MSAERSSGDILPQDQGSKAALARGLQALARASYFFDDKYDKRRKHFSETVEKIMRGSNEAELINGMVNSGETMRHFVGEELDRSLVEIDKGIEIEINFPVMALMADLTPFNPEPGILLGLTGIRRNESDYNLLIFEGVAALKTKAEKEYLVPVYIFPNGKTYLDSHSLQFNLLEEFYPDPEN